VTLHSLSSLLFSFSMNHRSDVGKSWEDTESSKKGKFVPMLNEFKHYSRKAYGGVDV
jgi:hypothetical protein